MVCRLLLLALICLQDPPLERFIEQLGDADPSVRNEAVRKLRDIGPSARAAVEKALRSPDAEVRSRATDLVRGFERERLQTLLEGEERKKAFPRITVRAADVPRGDVLSEYSRQSGLAWDPYGSISLEEKVSVTGTNLPLIQALEQIGLEWRYPLSGRVVVGPEEPARGPTVVFDDGVRVAFSRRPWAPKGTPTGTILQTEVKSAFDGELRWSVASVKTDRPCEIETCAIHSPELVYVASPQLADPRVTIRGTRVWLCPTPIEFKNPRNGEDWDVRSCRVEVSWPNIRVRMATPLTEALLKKTLSPQDIQFTVKPGREKDLIGVGIGGGGGGRYGGRFGRQPLAWCGCDDQPATKRPNPPSMAQELLIRIPSADNYSLGDIASLSITFHKPVEDAFELISPPLH